LAVGAAPHNVGLSLSVAMASGAEWVCCFSALLLSGCGAFPNASSLIQVQAPDEILIHFPKTNRSVQFFSAISFFLLSLLKYIAFISYYFLAKKLTYMILYHSEMKNNLLKT
jgi:hypothetical protein